MEYIRTWHVIQDSLCKNIECFLSCLFSEFNEWHETYGNSSFAEAESIFIFLLLSFYFAKPVFISIGGEKLKKKKLGSVHSCARSLLMHFFFSFFFIASVQRIFMYFQWCTSTFREDFHIIELILNCLIFGSLDCYGEATIPLFFSYFFSLFYSFKESDVYPSAFSTLHLKL